MWKYNSNLDNYLEYCWGYNCCDSNPFAWMDK